MFNFFVVRRLIEHRLCDRVHADRAGRSVQQEP